MIPEVRDGIPEIREVPEVYELPEMRDIPEIDEIPEICNTRYARYRRCRRPRFAIEH